MNVTRTSLTHQVELALIVQNVSPEKKKIILSCQQNNCSRKETNSANTQQTLELDFATQYLLCVAASVLSGLLQQSLQLVCVSEQLILLRVQLTLQQSDFQLQLREHEMLVSRTSRSRQLLICIPAL